MVGMSELSCAVGTCLAAYLAGSVPFGYVVGRAVVGRDIRQMGSGNIGATNVARVLGAKWGLLVLVLDCLKGLLPVLLFPTWCAALDSRGWEADGSTGTWSAVGGNLNHLRVACGAATIAGHMFPCWLGLRGGKGVATALGVIAVLAPAATGVAFATFLAALLTFRIVSLSSILAAGAFAVFQFATRWVEFQLPENWSLAAFSALVPMLITYRHRSNLRRLMRGEEPKFRLGGNANCEARSDA